MIDWDAADAVDLLESFPAMPQMRDRWEMRDRWDQATVWSSEANRSRSGTLRSEPTLVYQAVVIGTQLNEVRELRGPSTGPVVDVVRV